MKKPNLTKSSVTVFGLSPSIDQASKPSDLIQINGHQTLTLYARRCITILWHNAHRQGIETNKQYSIETHELVQNEHKGFARAEDAIIQLMQTILTIKCDDGSTSRVQFLGGNNLSDETKSAGVLKYNFDPLLISILENADIWGKISLPILMSLSSKYGVSLYENVCQWTGLTRKTSQKMTLEEFRELLGVEGKKYSSFGVLNTHVIKTVVREINALAPFNVSILPIKTGKKVTDIRIGWWDKSDEEMKLAWAETNRSRIGRKARISGQEEHVIDPSPSVYKMSKKK